MRTVLATNDLKETIFLADRVPILPRETGGEPRLIDFDLSVLALVASGPVSGRSGPPGALYLPGRNQCQQIVLGKLSSSTSKRRGSTRYTVAAIARSVFDIVRLYVSVQRAIGCDRGGGGEGQA